jgi:hypothetical protein
MNSKKDKFLTVVCDLETGEPLWFGRERKQETLDEFFRTELRQRQRERIEAAWVDRWEPFRKSIEEWAPQCKIVYDKFHSMQHANDAVDEVRWAEFFRKGKQGREVIKGKRWLLLSRWRNLSHDKRGDLNELFGLNRRVFKAYMLKESLDRLWDYVYPGAMFNYLNKWMDQRKWQRLEQFEKLADMLVKHAEGIANYRPSGRGRRGEFVLPEVLTPMCGERPNSPIATTSVSFNSLRWCMSSTSADRLRSSFGQCRSFKGPKLAPCVSQESISGLPFATAGQFTCTKRVPASISRRASSRLCPKVVMP